LGCRAAAESLDVRFVKGDAEALPFDDPSFDAVISVVGVMFAPIKNARPPSCCASAARAGRSRWPAGCPTASPGSSCGWW
jgi:hypothetical protein